MIKAIVEEKLDFDSKLILIVDDEKFMADMVTTAIKAHPNYHIGHDIEHVDTVEKAMEKATHYFYDHIILDGLGGRAIDFIIWLYKAKEEQVKNVISFTSDPRIAREMGLLGVELDSKKDVAYILEIIGYKKC